MPDRCYCSVEDVVGWGSKDEAELLTFVRSASDWITKKIGDFIPVTAAKRYDGTGDIDLTVAPLLAVTSIVDDGDTLVTADYLLYPRNKWWENGPYTRIRIDPDATTLNAWTWEEDIVVITGRWGLYEESANTGATVQDDPLTNSATSLLVDDGSKIRPGLVLLVETEQLFVEATSSTVTDSTADTAEAVDNSEEAIDTSDGTKVNIGEIIKIDNEKMLVLDIQSNTIVVERGWGGTTRATHNTSVNINVYRTFTIKRGVNGTTAAEHVQTTAISKYIPPWEVKYLCKQMASIMSKKADSSYAGKTGNVELGEVFYHDEMPTKVLKEIKKQYLVARRHGA
jgi:hypothetical protein